MGHKRVKLGKSQREVLDLLNDGGEYTVYHLGRLLDGVPTSNRIRHAVRRLRTRGLIAFILSGHAKLWSITANGIDAIRKSDV